MEVWIQCSEYTDIEGTKLHKKKGDTQIQEAQGKTQNPWDSDRIQEES